MGRYAVHSLVICSISTNINALMLILQTETKGGGGGGGREREREANRDTRKLKTCHGTIKDTQEHGQRVSIHNHFFPRAWVKGFQTQSFLSKSMGEGFPNTIISFQEQR